MEADNTHSQSKKKHGGTDVDRFGENKLGSGYQYFSFTQFIRVLIVSNFPSIIVSPNLYIVNPYMQSLFIEISHKLYYWIFRTPYARHKHLTNVKNDITERVTFLRSQACSLQDQAWNITVKPFCFVFLIPISRHHPTSEGLRLKHCMSDGQWLFFLFNRSSIFKSTYILYLWHTALKHLIFFLFPVSSPHPWLLPRVIFQVILSTTITHIQALVIWSLSFIKYHQSSHYIGTTWNAC